MVEIFKTNVTERDHANMLVELIHKNYSEYKANFDLDDCDKILRIKSTSGYIEPSCLIELLKDFGFVAEIFSDD